ncbi:MAG: spore coat associated protein CotJA [Clostridiales bacterium]|nr:spore coat associated protein CotJA [Clostridiales bacterium]
MKKDSVIKNTDSLPLAMAYVPWQTWGNLYKPEDGLMQGTIFEELDKPFTGRGCVR